MNLKSSNKVWDLFIELRRELVESQKIRAQITGFKISFVSATMGLMAADMENLDKALFVIPAFASICFDYIIYSYSFAIKRIGFYCRKHVEPALKAAGEIPTDFKLWQEYLADPRTRQRLSFVGNFGFTVLNAIIGLVALFFPFRPLLSSLLGLALIAFLCMDIVAFRSPEKIGHIWRTP
jgi:hypothetical protein